MERPRGRDVACPTIPVRFKTRCRPPFTGRWVRSPFPRRTAGSRRPIGFPHYAERIAELKAKGAELIVIFGIGRVCHIAFWEPHFAEEFASLAEWKAQTHRIGARLHPLTIEQNALDELQESDDARSRLRQYDRPGAFFAGRSNYRRCRRCLRPRDAMAGSQPLDDSALRARSLGSQLVHAHASRPIVLPPRSGRAARAGDELNSHGKTISRVKGITQRC